MKEIRRRDREITVEEAWSILTNAEYGVLSMVSTDGGGYGIPLNFCVVESHIYFHCALEGEKIDNLKHNSSVSFCAVGNTEVLPDKFGTRYESAMASGKAQEVFDGEKRMALEGLVKKYSPGFIESGAKYIEALTDKTRVFRVVIDNLSGKARRN